MPWSVSKAQQVFGMEAGVKQRTPDHDFPRTEEQAASFERYMQAYHSAAKKQNDDRRTELERKLAALDSIDYFMACGSRTFVRDPALKERLDKIVADADAVQFKKGDVVINIKDHRMRVLERRQDGTCLAKQMRDDGTVYGNARKIDVDHDCCGVRWALVA